MLTIPKLYVSYGMPKSGSTLAFELTRTMLELVGENQNRLCGSIVHPDPRINFVNVLDKPILESLQQVTASRSGPCVVKTHSKLYPKVSCELKSGHLFGQAVYRDPRDIALSMLDAARENRAWGRGPNGLYQNARETIPRIRNQIKHFLEWASCDNILPLHYEDIAFDTEVTIARIATQLGIQADAQKVIDIVINERFTQKNRGIPQRWKSEMLPADAEILADEFADFIAKYCSDLPGSPVIRRPRNRIFSFFSRNNPR